MWETLTEKEKLGNLLLDLYHRSIFGYHTNGLINKSILYDEFCKKKEYELDTPVTNNTIGTLLNRNGFGKQNLEDSEEFEIIFQNFFEYRKKVRDAYDKNLINSYVLLSNQKEETLVYQSSEVQAIKQNFSSTKGSCVICQKNYPKQYFKSHIKCNHFNTNILNLELNLTAKMPNFKISYQECFNSMKLRFVLRTLEKDLMIEHIVAVFPDCMINLKNKETPYVMPSSGIDYFFIDRNKFSDWMEYPILIVVRNKDDKLKRIVEKHLLSYDNADFFDEAELEKGRSELDTNLVLKNIYPHKQLKDLNSKNYPNIDLMNLNPGIRSYLENGKNLNADNIVGALKILLQIEDLYTLTKIDKLNQKDVKIIELKKHYKIELQKSGLNNSPGELLSKNDEIIIVRKNYRGEVISSFSASLKKIDHNDIYILKDDIEINETEKYDVKFNASRLNMMFQYMALDLLDEEPRLKQILFPTCSGYPTSAEINLEYYNKKFLDNIEQMEAVKNIVDDECNKSIPFILSGPPGTGKTTVITESILQIRRKFPNSRILVCSGSNAAVDEIAKKLLECDEYSNNVFRIYSSSIANKRYDNIEEILLKNSNLHGAKHYYPSVTNISGYPIICCTLTVLGKYIHYGRMRRDFFSYCFIDECGAITEIEVLIAITGVLGFRTKLILSGDVKQLGPVIQSEKAKDLGLGKSLMERLLERECYKVDEKAKKFNRRIQCRLVQNYRSHLSILNTFNDLFYDSELTSYAPKELTDWAMNWYNLPSLKCPIIFNAVYGECCRSPGSTSSFNFEELSLVMDYVKDLMYFAVNDRKVQEEDIGIISPYKSQCSLIRKELDKRYWHKIETGSVEIFQGRQKPIIIVSLVRSFTKNLEFLSCPKRLNVMLSRPQALLILIGNPETLQTIPNFEKLIKYCAEKNAFTGIKYNRCNYLDNISLSDLTICGDLQKLNTDHNFEVSIGTNSLIEFPILSKSMLVKSKKK